MAMSPYIFIVLILIILSMYRERAVRPGKLLIIPASALMGRISIVSAGVFSFRITCGDQRHFIIDRAGLRVWHWEDGKCTDSPGNRKGHFTRLTWECYPHSSDTFFAHGRENMVSFESNEMFIAIIHSMFFVPLGTITARNIMLYKAYRRLTAGKVSIQ